MQTIKRRGAIAILCTLAALTAFALTVGIAQAGGCRVRIRSSGDQVLLVPSYAGQGYAFQVGSELQIEAIAERVAARVLAQLAAGQQPQQPQSPAESLPQPAEQPAVALSLLAQKCGKCHDGTNPDRVQLVGVELSCEQRIEAIRRLLIEPGNPEHMPKGGQLTAEELGDLIGELSGAK